MNDCFPDYFNSWLNPSILVRACCTKQLAPLFLNIFVPVCKHADVHLQNRQGSYLAWVVDEDCLLYAFYTEKSGFKKNYEPIGGGRPTAPPPLNPPLLSLTVHIHRNAATPLDIDRLLVVCCRPGEWIATIQLVPSWSADTCTCMFCKSTYSPTHFRHFASKCQYLQCSTFSVYT